jgi:hypothetical protein
VLEYVAACADDIPNIRDVAAEADIRKEGSALIEGFIMVDVVLIFCIRPGCWPNFPHPSPGGVIKLLSHRIHFAIKIITNLLEAFFALI